MESTPELAAEGLAIVRILAAVLDRLVTANIPIALSDPAMVTNFHAVKAPGISIQQYLERIHKYASCSNECFILALIYVDRLIRRNNFILTELNVHKVVITAVLLAAKFFDDAYYNNAYYAKVGGVLTSEINGLEVDFLFRIHFSLRVTSDEFEKYRTELLSHLSMVAPEHNSYQYHNTIPQHVHTSPIIPFVDGSDAMAAFTTQLALQQALDHHQESSAQQIAHQKNMTMLSNEVCSQDFAETIQRHITSQITPSPPNKKSDTPNIMNTITHCNEASAVEDIIEAAKNNLILQRLEILQQTMDGGGNNTYPTLHRTNSMPVRLTGSSNQYEQSAMTTANASFSIMPQSCPLESLQQVHAIPQYTSQLEEEYLRFLVDGNQMQHPLFEQGHEKRQNLNASNYYMYNDPSSANSETNYSNMMMFQNEARRLAVVQGHMLAAAGISGAGCL